jgi:hypothetical protein
VAVLAAPEPIPDNALLSPLWGEGGEMFSHKSMLSDWSQAGYAGKLLCGGRDDAGLALRKRAAQEVPAASCAT